MLRSIEMCASATNVNIPPTPPHPPHPTPPKNKHPTPPHQLRSIEMCSSARNIMLRSIEDVFMCNECMKVKMDDHPRPLSGGIPKNNKTRLLGHILRAPQDDPMREVLFESGTLRPCIEHCRRVGKPRAQWLFETYQGAYAQISPHVLFDLNDLDHMNLLARWAHRRERPFNTRRFYRERN